MFTSQIIILVGVLFVKLIHSWIDLTYEYTQLTQLSEFYSIDYLQKKSFLYT